VSKLKILVAEDETIIRLDLVEMLTEAGYEVVAQAENGLRAIELTNESISNSLELLCSNEGIDENVEWTEKL